MKQLRSFAFWAFRNPGTDEFGSIAEIAAPMLSASIGSQQSRGPTSNFELPSHSQYISGVSNPALLKEVIVTRKGESLGRGGKLDQLFQLGTERNQLFIVRIGLQCQFHLC